MAGIEDNRSDGDLFPGSDEEAGADASSRQFMKEEIEAADGWGATGVSIDPLILEGRRGTRGFTITMGKPDLNGDGRRDRRAQTLPAMGSRREDFALSEESLRRLKDESDELTQCFRRGSAAVMHTVVPEDEFRGFCVEHCNCFLSGKMTDGQSFGDERIQEWGVSDHLPGALPPVVSCLKGSKGFGDTSPNQDNYSIACYKNGWSMVCCMDGHGPFGHMVSTRTVRTVPYYLANSKHFPDNMESALVEAFERSQKEVVAAALEGCWDVLASGTTAVAALWKGKTVWTATAGDSRCVIGYESSRKMLFETEDHKPNTPTERARIEACGGEVRSQTYPDGWTNHRIFIRGQDFPGLCMARTLGDQSVKAHGVIATPEVRRVEVDLEALPFLLLATDGVWEFLESEFVVKAVGKMIRSDGAQRTVRKLQKVARKRWREEEGDYCDDITSVLVQLRWQRADGAVA